MGYVLDQIAATAISYTVAGNSGISSFLTLFIIGCIEKYDGDILNMDENMEICLSSTVSLTILAGLTGLEFVAMCVPIVDELTDTAMTFVIPVVSVVGTLSTLGLYGDGDGNRRLEVDEYSMLWFWRVFVIVSGIGVALTMHFFKMLVRLVGAGWLTSFLTVAETLYCIIGLLLAIFFQAFAILFASAILFTVLWHWRRRLNRTQEQKEKEQSMRQQQLDTKKNGKQANDVIKSENESTATLSTPYNTMV